MNKIEQKYFSGERALYGITDTEIIYSTFDGGESPLKECGNILLRDSLFRWKYPLWYCHDIEAENCTFFETARAGIWYTENISLTSCTVDAPKAFRRCTGITLRDVTLPFAAETLWSCSDIKADNITARGDYLFMNSEKISISGLNLTGNYCFDGCRDVRIDGARIISKDCFWNSENVVITNSFISGEYVGWNAKNVTFEGCTIESLQGLCYMDGVTLRDCRLINTTLAFEYSVVDAQIKGSIDSVFNPKEGYISADNIGELTLDSTRIDPYKTEIAAQIESRLPEKE